MFSFTSTTREHRKSVLIDLETIGDLWEDIYDILAAHTQRDEPKVPWEALKAELQAELAREDRVRGEIRDPVR